MKKTDITIIGVGVIGLAISHALKSSGKDIVVIEKNQSFGRKAK